MTTVNMRERRLWWGGKRFEMEDTAEKPKTFKEREEEAIGRFFGAWFLLSLIPALIVGALYLVTPIDGLVLPYPWIAPFMAVAVVWLLNLPNLAIALIRSLALGIVTYGRD